MNLIVLPQAADEFEDAVAHYDDKQPGLGQRFRDEVDRHMRWIVGHPDIPRLRSGGYRRVNLKVPGAAFAVCVMKSLLLLTTVGLTTFQSVAAETVQGITAELALAKTHF